MAPLPSGVIVSGFLNEVLGIGQAGRLTIDRLLAAGIPVTSEDLRPLNRGLLTRPATGLPEAPIWLIHANPPEARIALFRHTAASWMDKYRIGYWAWESSVAPDAWAGTARWFHEIWTPSQSALDAYAAAFQRTGHGAQIPKLRVVPHAVPVATARRSFDQPVRVLVLFDPRSDFDRKNPQGAVEAWLRAFPTAGCGRLTIKCLAGADSHPRLAALRRLTAGRDDIDILVETMTHAETEALISRSDILLSMHRAEGFGLPLAEAMARGLVVIATGWSGNMQFMTERNSIPLPYRLVSASRRYNGPVAQWAEPDVKAATCALQTAVADTALRRRLGAQAQVDIARLNAIWSRDTLFPQP